MRGWQLERRVDDIGADGVGLVTGGARSCTVGGSQCVPDTLGVKAGFLRFLLWCLLTRCSFSSLHVHTIQNGVEISQNNIQDKLILS